MSARAINEVQSCSICFKDLTSTDLSKIEIGKIHACFSNKIHEECIKNWLKEHNTCPFCRAIIPITSLSSDSPAVSSTASVTPSFIDSEAASREGDAPIPARSGVSMEEILAQKLPSPETATGRFESTWNRVMRSAHLESTLSPTAATPRGSLSDREIKQIDPSTGTRNK